MPARKPSGIAKWPEDERPRERLLARGAHALTDAELLAILLRVGVQGKNAVALARELLEKFGSLQGMMTAPLTAWDEIKGVKGAKLVLDILKKGKVLYDRAETWQPLLVHRAGG